MPPPPPTRQEVLALLRAHLSEATSVESVPLGASFHDLGVDSARAIRLATELSALLDRDVPPTLLWAHRSPAALAEHLTTNPTREHGVPQAAPRSDEPIAIVGIGCRFPGEADSPDRFWDLLMQGRDATREVPADRWDHERFFSADPRATGTYVQSRAGFLERVADFDAAFFGISPREATAMDPRQRLALELAWEALEDAGIDPRKRRGSATGVFVGAIGYDYAVLTGRLGEAAAAQHTSTGLHTSIVANRVSYALGLEGPSLAVDTACSSSLVAVALACQSLRSGECDAALAGGVHLMLAPFETVSLSRFGALSPDGVCRAFADGANGMVRGEGGALMVLERLSDALARSRNIVAVVHAAAVNQDGASNGLPAPNPAAQRRMLEEAYRRAGVAPARVQYVEAHGTGTKLGDPIEAQALGEVFGAERDPADPLRIGSVKTNIGHLEGAAGAAGLVKLALCIQRRELPPSLHFERPNPLIPFDRLRVAVQRERTQWPRPDQPLWSGVSGFGFGGTNCHLVLRDHEESRAVWVSASADTESALAARVDDVARAAAAATSPRALTEVATAASRSTAQALRVWAVGDTPDAVAEELRRATAREPAQRPRLVFVFSGRGGQWLGMGRGLSASEPVFCETLDRCAAVIERTLGWSLRDEIHASSDNSRLHRTDVVQPLIVALQIATVETLRAHGVVPDVVLGHSMGDMSAAFAAGVLTLDDTMQLICEQSRIQQRIAGLGVMGIVSLDAERVSGELAAEPELFVAAHNGPASTVIAGPVPAVERSVTKWRERGIFASRIDVDTPVHGPPIWPHADDLERAFSFVRPRTARLTYLSTVEAGRLRGPECDAAYWRRNLCQPVRFAEALSQALDGASLVVEVGPHPTLLRAVEASATRDGVEARTVATSRRDADERACLLRVLATAWQDGGLHDPTDEDALVSLSAADEAALIAHAQRLDEELGRRPALTLCDLAYTLSTRAALDNRLAIVGASTDEIRGALRAHVAGGDLPDGAFASRVTTEAQVAFVFPGQGSQWPGMGLALFEREAAFADELRRCEVALAPELGASVIELLRRSRHQPELLQRVELVQPLLFALQISLSALWQSLGVSPAFVVGHSMGEVAAACVAKALSLEDGARIIARRSALVARRAPPGAMALVDCSAAELAPLLAAFDVEVAAYNGPSTVVLAGASSQVDAILERLQGDGVFCRRVDVTYASHSRHVDPLLAELAQLLGDVSPVASAIPLVSTAREGTAPGETLDAAYWCDNLRAPVRFMDAIRRTAAAGPTIFVEVSPHPVVLSAVLASAPDAKAVGTLRRNLPERRAVLESLAALWAGGAAIGDRARSSRGRGRLVSLPSYPWQRRRFWVSDGVSAATNEGRLLGKRVEVVGSPGLSLWLSSFDPERYPQLRDHAVDDVSLMPGVGMVLLALQAVVEALGPLPWELCDVAFHAPWLLDQPCELQLTLDTQGERWRITLATATRAEGAHRWIEHMTCDVARPTRDREAPPAPPSWPLDEHLVEDVYARLRGQGLHYGPSFRCVRAARLEEGRGWAAVTRAHQGFQPFFGADPGLLDACLQLSLLLGDDTSGGAPVLRRIERIRVYTPASDEAFAVLEARNGRVDARILDRDGQPSFCVFGLTVERLSTSGVPAHADDQRYGLVWNRSPLPATQSRDPGEWALIAPPDLGDPLRAALVARGARVVCLAESPALVAECLGSGAPPKGVMIMETARLTGDGSPAERAAKLCHQIVRLFAEVNVSPRLWLVTRGAQHDLALSGRRPVDAPPIDATLWGLGRSLAYERADLRPSLIDLPSDPSGADLERLADELVADGDETQIALDGEARLVARLCRKSPPRALASLRLRRDRSYLITGGLSGLGLELAQAMADWGAGRLLLLGRSAPNKTAGATLAHMRALGVDCRALRVDVSEIAPLEQSIEDNTRDKPLAGIVHAAAVLDDGLLHDLTEARWLRVMAPKIDGAWNLYQATRGAPLELFVMFGSVAGLLGNAGQASYAAANTFLTTLALGAPTALTTIDWGAFASVGLAAAEAHGSRLAARGLASMPPAWSADGVRRALHDATRHVAVMDLDAARWVEAYPGVASPTWQALLDGHASKTAAHDERTDPWRHMSPPQAERALTESVAHEAARVLRCADTDIPTDVPLQRLGLDSLMGLELRNRLDRLTGVCLPITTLWRYPSVAGIATAILARLPQELGGAHAREPVITSPVVAAKPPEQEVASLSIEELASALALELEEGL